MNIKKIFNRIMGSKNLSLENLSSDEIKRLIEIKKDEKIRLLTILVGISLFLVLANSIMTFGFLDKLPVTGKSVEYEESPYYTADNPIIGSEKAPVTMVIFSEFECPYCGVFATQVFPLIMKDYINTGKVKVVFRNFLIGHPHAQKAAEAALCAHEQGKFWQYHDILFKNQQALDIDSLKNYAQNVKLNMRKFNSCLDSGKMAASVQKDHQDGQTLGVRGTPAFFINDKSIVGAQPYAQFRIIIEGELAKK